MQHEIDVGGDRGAHVTPQACERSKKAAPMAPMPCANRRTGDVARERGMRSRLRAHKTFEVHPGSRKGVALTAPTALTALTTVACRPAMRDPGAGDKKPRAERAERAETPAALPLPLPLPPAATAQAASDRQHHLADMVGALELGMRAGGVLERED